MQSKRGCAGRGDVDAVADAWAMFRAHLDARIREINEEVAHYPTPIARCDEQLTKLLEQRARIFRQRNAAADLGPMPSDAASADWLLRVGDYLTTLEPCVDDDVETMLRRRIASLTSAR
jgi:hypothetical protein